MPIRVDQTMNVLATRSEKSGMHRRRVTNQEKRRILARLFLLFLSNGLAGAAWLLLVGLFQQKFHQPLKLFVGLEMHFQTSGSFATVV